MHWILFIVRSYCRSTVLHCNTKRDEGWQQKSVKHFSYFWCVRLSSVIEVASGEYGDMNPVLFEAVQGGMCALDEKKKLCDQKDDSVCVMNSTKVGTHPYTPHCGMWWCSSHPWDEIMYIVTPWICTGHGFTRVHTPVIYNHCLFFNILVCYHLLYLLLLIIFSIIL